MSIRATELERLLADEAATDALASSMASAIHAAPLLIALEGELGAGKTTLVRGMLRALGHEGRVVSPTYTLMEDYEAAGFSFVHLDLFRIGDPEELEFLGLRDRLADSIVLVEWPERGVGWLPAPDIRVKLEILEAGRRATLSAGTEAGQAVLGRVARRPHA